MPTKNTSMSSNHYLMNVPTKRQGCPDSADDLLLSGQAKWLLVLTYHFNFQNVLLYLLTERLL